MKNVDFLTQDMAYLKIENTFISKESILKTSRTRWGIFYMLIGILSFAISNVFVKTASLYYPLGEMVILRGIIFLIPWAFYLILSYHKNIKTILFTRHINIHILQGILSAFCLYFLFYAFKVMPLSDATAVSFAETFILTILAIPFLKEHVQKQTWSAIIAGFLGVVLVTQPNVITSNFHLTGTLSCLLAVTFDAIVLLSLRKIGQIDSALTIITYYTLFSTLGGILFLPFEVWVPITHSHLWDITGLGVFGAFGQIFLTLAFQRTTAGTLAPLIYTMLIWSLLFDEVIWGHWPSLSVIGGATIIILSGLYVIQKDKSIK